MGKLKGNVALATVAYKNKETERPSKQKITFVPGETGQTDKINKRPLFFPLWFFSLQKVTFVSDCSCWDSLLEQIFGTAERLLVLFASAFFFTEFIENPKDLHK